MLFRSAAPGCFLLLSLLAGACSPASPDAEGAGGSTSSSGAGDEGGGGAEPSDGGAPPMICEPGATEYCYDGPEDTFDKGICHRGVRTCSDSGLSWSGCEGSVEPQDEEVCSNGVDDDCDGDAEENCTCTPGATQACYTAATNTQDVGLCHAGEQECQSNATWGDCVGQVIPATETCVTPDDEDCDGTINEGGDGCLCVPNAQGIPCYSGAIETRGVGLCQDGTGTCNALGTGWSACSGDVVPVEEDCTSLNDEDCDGKLNNDCPVGDEYSTPYPATGGAVAVGAYTSTNDALWVAANFSGVLDLFDMTLSTSGLSDVDAVVFKVNPEGDLAWAEQFGGVGTQEISGFIHTGTTIAVSVNHLGETTLPGLSGFSSQDWGSTLVTMSTISGNLTYTRRLAGEGTSNAVRIHGLGSITATDFIAVGDFSGEVCPVWDGACPGSDCQCRTAVGGKDAFALRWNALDASLVWFETFGEAGGTTGDESATAVSVDGVASIIVGTFTESIALSANLAAVANQDGFVAKLDETGTPVWSTHLVSTNSMHPRGVAFNGAKAMVVGEFQDNLVAGAISLIGGGAGDAFATSINTQTGAVQWAEGFGDALEQEATTVLLDSAGKSYVAGHMQGALDCGGGEMASVGGYDIFLCAFDSAGNHLGSQAIGYETEEMAWGMTLTDGTYDLLTIAGSETFEEQSSTTDLTAYVVELP